MKICEREKENLCIGKNKTGDIMSGIISFRDLSSYTKIKKK